MNRHTILILMTFSLFACACNPPKIEPQARCVTSFTFDYGEDQEIVDFFNAIEKYKGHPELRDEFVQEITNLFGKTRCHQYDLMKQKRVSDAIDYPLSDSDDNVGFHAFTWAKEITPWAKESRRYYEDTCKKK